MLKFRRITTLLSFLLINILATSCGCGEKEEKERKALVAEEKKLTETLKKHFKPGFYKNIDQDIKDHKGNKEKIKSAILFNKGLLTLLDLIENGNSPNINNISQTNKAYFAKVLLSIEDIEVPSNFDMSEPDAIHALMSKENIVKVRSAIQDSINLHENLEKQAELKDRSKESNDKRAKK
jgi:hypothetical protein